MNKKYFCVGAIFTASFLFISSASASETKRRGLVEFCELFAERFTDAQRDMGIDENMCAYSSGMLSDFGDFILVPTAAGSAEVYKNTLEIKGISLTVHDFNAESSKNAEMEREFIAAFSALEFDYFDDFYLSSQSEILGGPKSAYIKSIGIYNNEIVENINEYIRSGAESGKDELIYSGNYDYYVTYDEFEGESSGMEFQILSIEAREHD